MTAHSTHSTLVPLTVPDDALVARFRAIVGAPHAITDAAEQDAYLSEWRDLYRGRTPVVLKPGSTDEVSRILDLANRERVAIVTQGGNTGLVGGQIPSEAGSEIVLSLKRLNRLRHVDEALTSLTVEAGMTLAEVQAKARDLGRLFPLSLASEGSATIGGALATNAGGVAVLAYGTARALALGIEAVMADGRVWNGLSALKKDNTGFDLRDLLIGSEGTLGVITAATVKLFPAPGDTVTALLAVNDRGSLLPLFRHVESRVGSQLTAFEFMCRDVLEMVQTYMGRTIPFDAIPPMSVLIELTSHRADGRLSGDAEALIESAIEAGYVTDAVIATSIEKSRALWRLREECSESQKGAGGSIKHDVSVPVERIARFLEDADRVVESVCPGARPVPFGHFGDGNVHYNVTQPRGMDKAQYLALWERMSEAVHDVVLRHGGSISAEHGIGRLKRGELTRVKSPLDIDLMRRIKSALDPNGILNPGKVI